MTIDITPEANENLWRFWANKAQALAEENKALSAALTQSSHDLEMQKIATSAANTAWDQTFEALTASQAETAAAYEAAAWVCISAAHERRDQIEAGRNVPVHEVNVPQQMRWSASAIQAETLRDQIHALTSVNSKAALDRMIAEAEERGRNIGVATEKLGRLVEWLKEDEYNVFLLPADDVEKMQAILAAIPKGKDHDKLD